MFDTEKLARVATALKPHQTRVTQRIQRPGQPGLIVSHGLGSGKTLTSIAVQDALDMKADVLVPAALQENYLKERDKHVEGKSPEVVMTTLQRVSRSGQVGGNPLLIVDEAHRAREPGTKAQKALMGTTAKKRILLTASPFYNRPSDIAGLINIAAGDKVLPADRTEFRKRYISETRVSPGLLGMLTGKKHGVKENINPSQVSFLRGVFSKWVDQHGSSTEDFPEVERKIVQVPMGPKQRSMYDAIIGKAPAWVRFKVKRGLPPSKQESRQLNAFAGAVRQISNTTRAHAPDEPPEETKIDYAFGRLQSALKKDKKHKAIVYSNYLEAGVVPYRERLVKAKIPFGEYTGEMKKKDRDALVNDFNAGRKKVILLSSAGGEGLDLKGTRLVQILEPHWNNEKLRQVEGRAIRYKSHSHLPAKDRKVLVESYLATKPRKGILEKAHVLSPGGGIDEYLDTMAGDKDKLINQFKALLPDGGKE